ncbi:hypothetical protein [Azospirillum humicireducens]|uniref:hypothetical protein n=1 Tax=Azospirillum humicireducens TaxID=1226968 RepID=UPI001B3B86C4|nr:hypothetical protein [Azospirillum humicireducens]
MNVQMYLRLSRGIPRAIDGGAAGAGIGGVLVSIGRCAIRTDPADGLGAEGNWLDRGRAAHSLPQGGRDVVRHRKNDASFNAVRHGRTDRFRGVRHCRGLRRDGHGRRVHPSSAVVEFAADYLARSLRNERTKGLPVGKKARGSYNLGRLPIEYPVYPRAITVRALA